MIELRVQSGEGGVRLDYRLPAAVNSFRFEPDEHIPRAADIRLLTPGLRMVGGKIDGTEPFTEFSLAVRPDRGRQDATYPALAAVGAEGQLLYLPLFAPDPEDGILRVRFDVSDSAAVVRGSGDDGFAFLGPRSYVSESNGLTIIEPPELPAEMGSDIRGRADAILDYYKTRLGRSGGTRPVLVVDYDKAEDAAGFVGDVTPNGVVLVQLSPAVDRLPGGKETIISRFLAHEFFHLWNSPPYRETPGINGHWLREGAAEYASWLAAAALFPGQEQLEERITAQLGPCIATLADEALVALADQRSQTSRYSCGSIASWLTDVALRQTGNETFFTLWRSLLASEGGYDVASYEAMVAGRTGRAAEPLRSLLRGGDPGRWPKIFELLRSAGVNVEEVAPASPALRSAALQTLLRETCSADTVGFETLGLTEPPHSIILRTEPMGDDTTPTACGALAGDPELLAVNGRSSLGDWREISREINHACERRETVALKIRRGRVVETVVVRCTARALAPPTQYRVRRALPA